MEIVIENIEENLDRVVEFLERDISQSLSITSVKIEARWVLVSGDGAVIRNEELRYVIVFDLDPFPDDQVMRVLITAFEGTGFVFSVPEMPGFRWMIP